MKHITLENGTKVGVFSSAPANFNPLTASAVDLRRFGFPPMPTDAANRTRYEQLFHQMKGRLHYVEPEFKLVPHKAHITDIGVLPQAPITLGNTRMSGVDVVASNLDPFRWMEAEWLVPNVNAGNPVSQFCAFWVGLGAGSPQYQAGMVFFPSLSGVLEIFPFWEWIDNSGHGVILGVTNFKVDPGDLISVILCTDQGSGSTSGTIYFFNVTNGSHTSFITTGPALQTTIAEWGVGFPFLWGGSADGLADYGEVYFGRCNAVTNAFSLRTSDSGILINLTQDGTTSSEVFSSAELVSSNIVHCRYLGPIP